ncbi:MAG: hypothetical protein QXN33_01515 [Candidatus Bathyarchaeia archaeon]
MSRLMKQFEQLKRFMDEFGEASGAPNPPLRLEDQGGAEGDYDMAVSAGWEALWSWAGALYALISEGKPHPRKGQRCIREPRQALLGYERGLKTIRVP